MLKTLTPKLRCPNCRQPDARLSLTVFDDGDAGHVSNGVLQCGQCDGWYPIEDDLLELVEPSLLNGKELNRFCLRFERQLWASGIDILSQPISAAAAAGDFAAQLKQRRHFDWYADNSRQSYLDYARSPFWQAVDEATFSRWIKLARSGRWMLDVGCANGRASYRWMSRQPATLVGCDISKKLVRQAIERARIVGQHRVCTFLVADGNRLPFAAESFDYAMTYGVLHHLPNPGATCRQILSILKPRGTFFGSENNRTLFRGLFDLAMKLRPLWTEEAGTEPLISHSMLEQWMADLPVQTNVTTQVYMLPHLFNLLGQRAAQKLMPLLDRICQSVPLLNRHGGLIVFEIKKNQAAKPARISSRAVQAAAA